MWSGSTPINQPNNQPHPHLTAVSFAKAVAFARKHFKAVDTKPFLDFLDEGTKQLYQSREHDIQKLERMQESFFHGMTEFTLDQAAETAGVYTPVRGRVRYKAEDS